MNPEEKVNTARGCHVSHSRRMREKLDVNLLADSPHDPGDQHHGGFVEGVKESDELLALGPQLLQRHPEHHGEENQA